MFSFIWSLIVGGVIGAIAGAIVGKGNPAGIIGNIILGFLGSWVGTSLFGNWGPLIGGFAILPALIGAVITIAVYSFFFRQSAHN